MSMTKIFVDTSAWSALADAGDPNHEIALIYRDEIAEHCQLVVTNYILDELYTLMLVNQCYKEAVDFKNHLDIMKQEGILEIVWITEEIAIEAWNVFERFNIDKEWSFTDCVSFVVMKHLEIKEAFAFDHHFYQMGFIRKP
jgi:hypothetical protein